MVLHIGRDGAVQNAVDEALDGGHGGAQLVGNIAHELAPGVVVGLDIVRHLVEGAGQIGHFAFAVHALDPDGQVAAAEALGRIRHLLDGVGELMHHHLGEDAGHQQHQTGREEEVREELPAELHQPVARRAEEKVAGTLAALAAHLMHRDVALLGQYAVQRTEDVIILLGLGRLFQHGRLYHIPGQIVRV